MTGCVHVIALSLAGLLIGDCTMAEPKAKAIVGVVSGLGHRIEAFDFYAQDDGSLDLVWISSTKTPNTGYARWELWFSSSGPNGSEWSSPAVLIPHTRSNLSPFFPPRIIRFANQIHVFAGTALQHLVSGDGGTTWTELGPVLDQGQFARSFDVAACSQGLVLAALANRPMPAGGARTESLGVYVFHLKRGRERGLGRTLTWIGEASSSQGPMKLLPGHEEWHLIYSVEQMRHRDENGVRVVSMKDKVFDAVSVNEGESWSVPLEIEGRSLSEGFDAVRTRMGAAIFPGPTHVLQQERGSRWTALERGERPSSFFVGPAQIASPSAASDGSGKGQVFWIDSRHEKSDRSLLNPLGGIPWSDSPDWGNNDVFSLPLSSFLNPQVPLSRLEPIRWTRGMSFSKQVVTRATSNRIWVVWASCEGLEKRDEIYRAAMEFHVTSLLPE